MRSARYVVAFLSAFAILLAACGQQPSGGGGASPSTGAKAAYGGSVTFALENDVSNLDPMLSGLFVDRNIHYAMHDSLVRVTPNGEILPWRPGAGETPRDGKTRGIRLRPGAPAHDRTPRGPDSVQWR